MTREEFYDNVSAALTDVVANKRLDAWFFNDFDSRNPNCKENEEINKTLNALIPGKWKMVALSGNGTNVGLGIFHEKEHDLWLDLACYDEDYEEYIDDFNLDYKCVFKLDEDTLARFL
jgi:hypothetical protein